MTLPLHYLTTDHGLVNTVRHLTTTTRPGHTVLRYCLLWPSLPRQTVKLICFYFTQLFLKGFIPHHCTEAGFWQQIGRSVCGWLRGSPTGVPWLDPTLQGHSSKPGSFEKAEGWKIPTEARLPGTLVKKAELQSYEPMPAWIFLLQRIIWRKEKASGTWRHLGQHLGLWSQLEDHGFWLGSRFEFQHMGSSPNLRLSLAGEVWFAFGLLISDQNWKVLLWFHHTAS